MSQIGEILRTFNITTNGPDFILTSQKIFFPCDEILWQTCRLLDKVWEAAVHVLYPESAHLWPALSKGWQEYVSEDLRLMKNITECFTPLLRWLTTLLYLISLLCNPTCLHVHSVNSAVIRRPCVCFRRRNTYLTGTPETDEKRYVHVSVCVFEQQIGGELDLSFPLTLDSLITMRRDGDVRRAHFRKHRYEMRLIDFLVQEILMSQVFRT